MRRAAPLSNPIAKIRGDQCLIASYLGTTSIRVTPRKFSAMSEVELFLLDEKKFSTSNTIEDAILAMIYLRREWETVIGGYRRANVWSVGTSAANSGYGPLIYRLAMQAVCHGDHNWMTCGDDVSEGDRRLWRRMYQDPDIEVVPMGQLVEGVFNARDEHKALHDEPELNAIYRYVGRGVAGSSAAFRRGEALVQKYGSGVLHWLDQYGVRYFFAMSSSQWRKDAG